ncbi:hypothetical protein Tco_1468568 [Tanacetum coccineum]
MDETIHVSCIIDKIPLSWKDFKHTLKHQKEELTLVELGSHLRIEEPLIVQDNDKPKGNNVVGLSVVNMVEHNNSFRYIDNKGKCKGIRFYMLTYYACHAFNGWLRYHTMQTCFKVLAVFSRLVNLLEVKPLFQSSVKEIDIVQLGIVNQAELKLLRRTCLHFLNYHIN